MGIEFLDAVEDHYSWEEAVFKDLPAHLQDLYYHPDYVALHCLQPGMSAKLAVYRERYEHETACWIYPFILQPVEGHEGWYDIESPYGYAGPQSTSSVKEFLARAHQAFAEGARSLGVIAEFIRFHPILCTERWVDPEVEILEDRETRSIEIPAEGEVLDHFTGKARNMVRRAAREGLKVIQPPMTDCWQRFADLYQSNMERLDADAYYFFNPDYFHGLAALVDREGFLLVAEQDGEWQAAAIFLFGRPALLHYHLAATRLDQRIPGAANLLIAEAARRGQERACRQLHLGGGRTPDADDSLLKFKRAMGGNALPFLIGKRVLHPERYQAVKTAWAADYPELVPRYGNRILCYRYRS